MNYLKNIQDGKIILTIKTKVVDDFLVGDILKNLKPKKRTGLNMKHVETINSQLFIDCLLSNKFKLFNLKDEVLLYLSFILKDGFLKSYMNIEDFKSDKRELIRRKLTLI